MQAYRQKRYADAKQWFTEALTEAQRTKEPSPPQAMTLNNLAAVHEALGEFREAELRYQQSLAVVEAIQGPDHPDVVPGLNNLAALYAKQGDFRRAEPLWRRSLTILESALGPNHPHLIPSIMLIAQATQVQGRFEESEKLYTKALSIADTELAAQSPSYRDDSSPVCHLAPPSQPHRRSDGVRRTCENNRTKFKIAKLILYRKSSFSLLIKLVLYW